MIAFDDEDIEIEIRSPRPEPLYRLFKRDGASFNPPESHFRTARFDPPPGSQSKFAVLYTADNIATAAMECRVLTVDPKEQFTYAERQTSLYKVVHLQYSRPALFVRMDGRNEKKFGLGRFAVDYLPYQTATLAVFNKYGNGSRAQLVFLSSRQARSQLRLLGPSKGLNRFAALSRRGKLRPTKERP